MSSRDLRLALRTNCLHYLPQISSGRFIAAASGEFRCVLCMPALLYYELPCGCTGHHYIWCDFQDHFAINAPQPKNDGAPNQKYIKAVVKKLDYEHHCFNNSSIHDDATERIVFRGVW